MRRFAYGLLAACWIAGIWIWFRREDAAPTPAPLAPRAPALETPTAVAAKLEAPAQPRKLPSARARRRIASSPEAVPLELVRVRSSVGLPLIEVEVSIAGEAWQRVDLPQSGLEVEPEAYPLRIRAAGHLETEAARDAQEVVLEPDALLTVESPNLRTRAIGLTTLSRRQLATSNEEYTRTLHITTAGLLAEFPAADRLLVAFSPERLAPVLSGDVDVSFQLPDGRPLEFAVHPLAGLRARYALPADDMSGTAPLEVEIVDEGERPGWIRLWLADLEHASARATREEFAWGSVTTGERQVPAFPDPLWGRPSLSRVESLALGRRYALCAQDENEHYAEIEFVHDGAERKIVLQTPYTIVGRAVDAASGAGLGRPDVRGYPLGHPEDRDWFARSGPSDEVGGFELHVPGSSWGRQGAVPPLVAPERFTIVVSAEGHRSRELEIAWDGQRRIDLGNVALARSAETILVEMNDLLLWPWVDIGACTFSNEPALEWTLRHVVLCAQGDLELELAYAGTAADVLCRDLLSGESRTLPFAVPASALLLLCAGDEALAFRRGEKGRYEIVARTMQNVAVQCERLPDAGRWTLGWRSGDTWARFRTVDRTGPVLQGVLLPGIATELWWSAGEAPPDVCGRAGGRYQLGAGATVVLR